MNFVECPRCESKSYEHLKGHSYCVNCNYSPDYEDQESIIPGWAAAELGLAERNVSVMNPFKKSA